MTVLKLKTNTSPLDIAALVGLCETGFQRVLLFSSLPHCSSNALFLLCTWDLTLNFLLGNSALLPSSKEWDFQTKKRPFLDSPCCGFRRWKACTWLYRLMWKNRGLKSEASRFGQRGTGLGTSAGHSTTMADHSSSQQNMVCLLSADSSYYGIGILSMINSSCHYFPMKLTYVSTSSPDQELQHIFAVSLMLRLIIQNHSLFISNSESEVSLFCEPSWS